MIALTWVGSKKASAKLDDGRLGPGVCDKAIK
jgi:hypothetical protein